MGTQLCVKDAIAKPSACYRGFACAYVRVHHKQEVYICITHRRCTYASHTGGVRMYHTQEQVVHLGLIFGYGGLRGLDVDVC